MIPHWVSNPDPQLYYTEPIILDFETTNLEKGTALNPNNRLLLSTWYYQDKIYTKWGSEFEIQELLGLIEQVQFIVAHNSKFELQWLARAGLDISKVLVYDTQIGDYVLYGNKRKKLDLGSMAVRYGLGDKDKFTDLCMKGGICPSELPRSLLERRNVKDVYQTLGIFLAQREKLLQSGKLPVQYTRCLLTPVLSDIEMQGMMLDAERVEEEYRKQKDLCDDLRVRLDRITGGINPKSPPQVAHFLYGDLGFEEPRDRQGNVIRNKPTKQFPDGMPKTDEDTILSLKPRNKRQRDFIELKKEYTKAASALSKYLEFFLGVVREYDGVFYGQFNQTIARTHRLTSSGRKLKFKMWPKEKSVQFQNMPRIYKKLFKAKRGRVCEPDGAQLEFRVAGHLGRDVRALQDIVDGQDVHQITADTMTDAGQVTNRQEAKSRTFKPLYGGTSGTKAEQAYYRAFREKYPGIANTQEKWIQTVLNTKSLVTETGLEFFWPDTKITQPSGYITNRESICNYPVQMLATADIIPIAIVKLWHEMWDKKLKSKIINTIHDSSPLELIDGEEDEVRDLIINSYTHYVYYYLKQVYNIDFLAPLGVGIKIGDHWGEGDEEKLQINPPVKLEGVQYD